jgi:hypothetical protein
VPAKHDTESLKHHPTVRAIRVERAKAERHERYAARNRHQIAALLRQLVAEGHSLRAIGRAIGRSKQRVSQLTTTATDGAAR